MKRLFIIFAILFTLLIGSDPTRYTITSPPSSLPNDSLVFFRADRYAMGRKIITSDHQQMMQSLVWRIDSTYYADSTGFFTFLGNRLVYFVGDSTLISYLKADTLLGDPILKSSSTDSMGLVTKQFVEDLVSSISSGSVNTDTMYSEECSENVGALVYYSNGPDEWFDCDNTSEAKCMGLIGFYHGSGKIQTDGVFTTTGLTKGAIYYIGTSGGITSTAPTADNSIERILGRAISSTKLKLDIDPSWMEVLP